MTVPTSFVAPETYRKIVVRKLSNNFEEATQIETYPFQELVDKLKPSQVIVQNKHVGINASDTNFTAGRYDPTAKPPFDVGFEAVGVVVVAGAESKVPVGTSVGVIQNGSFAEYIIAESTTVIPIPSAEKKFVPILVSGLTSACALNEQGRMKSGETVLVTAAAGGAGVFAVQLAKLAGNHVIGTCSSAEKAEMLKKLGCDRVINYKTEDLHEVLKAEYPKGIDIAFESVGGKMFDACFKNMAPRGRLVVIGAISYYSDKGSNNPDGGSSMASIWKDVVSTLPLLSRSVSISGFFLRHFAPTFGANLRYMVTEIQKGKLLPVLHEKDDFVGLESVAEALRVLHTGKNEGKLVVSLEQPSRL